MNDTFSIYAPIQKFEEQPDGTLMVYGRATQEVLDSSREIMDYASSAPFFQRRSKENFDRSGGQNLMPLRAMHQPIAAGKVVQFDYLDKERAIDIASQVVDEQEIKKVRTGVYTGFSVGGRYERRWADPEGRGMRYTADPREISLVDAPAVPTAKLTLFKIDADEDIPAWVGEFRETVEELKKIRQAEQEERQVLLLKRKTIGENAGIAWREGSPLNAPNSEASSPAEYGDPANFAFPLCKESLCKESVDRFNQGVNREVYEPIEWHVLGRRIAMLAEKFGKYVYDPNNQQITKQEEPNMNDTDLSKLDVGAIVAGLKGKASQSAALASQDPQAALTMLLGAIDALNLGAPIRGNDVPVQDPSVALGKAVATGTTPSATAATEDASTTPSTTTSSTTSSVKKAAPPKAKAKAKAEPAEEESTETPEEESTETSTSPAEVYKAELGEVKQQIAEIAGSVNKLVEALSKRAAAPAGDSPVGALNAMVQGNADPDLDDPIIKALDEGGPYAMLKALKAAGAGDEIDGALAMQNVHNAIRKATYASLERGGVVTASRYIGRLLGPQ
jgi:hypothetical protein